MAIELLGFHPKAVSDVEGQDFVRRLATGDRDVIAAIYDRYAAGLYRVLAAVLSSQADAEDALQNVFLALAERRANRVRNLRAYLYTVARHEAFQMLRRRRREARVEVVEVAQASREIDGIDWQTLIATLPVEQREVIAMKVYEQMTFEEIAVIVGVSVNTAASRYRYGIARLRVALGSEDNHG